MDALYSTYGNKLVVDGTTQEDWECEGTVEQVFLKSSNQTIFDTKRDPHGDPIPCTLFNPNSAQQELIQEGKDLGISVEEGRVRIVGNKLQVRGVFPENWQGDGIVGKISLDEPDQTSFHLKPNPGSDPISCTLFNPDVAQQKLLRLGKNLDIRVEKGIVSVTDRNPPTQNPSSSRTP